MPAYNFKKQFAAPVESGHKLCTIRGKAPKVFSTAYLYTGMRTKQCRKLGEGVITRVTPFSIAQSAETDRHSWVEVTLDGHYLNSRHVEDLAIKDGFSDSTDFYDFFDEVYDGNFQGFLIEWELKV